MASSAELTGRVFGGQLSVVDGAQYVHIGKSEFRTAQFRNDGHEARHDKPAPGANYNSIGDKLTTLRAMRAEQTVIEHVGL